MAKIEKHICDYCHKNEDKVKFMITGLDGKAAICAECACAAFCMVSERAKEEEAKGELIK